MFNPLNLDYFHVNKFMFEIINIIRIGIIIETFILCYYETHPDNMINQIYEDYVPDECDSNLDWFDEESIHNLENLLEC